MGGCHVTNCGPFNALCEELDMYEWWTKEYVSALALYLLERAAEQKGDGRTVVVDVGFYGISKHKFTGYRLTMVTNDAVTREFLNLV